ncbi:MAG TPA: hypothetical protein VJS64_08315, partial [Pyrinomonadaceae bacterium]|nr:hypothetical protein [Pyrinomonadaceae bacterium]
GGVVMQKIQLMSEPSDRSLTTTEVASFFISVLRGPIRDRDGNTPEDFFMSVLQSLIRDRDWDTELAPPLISSERELSKFPGLALVDIRLQDPEAQDCRHTGKPAYGACTELLIAPLIDAFSYEFLIKTLELSDQMFEELYGATINSQERRKAMEIIRAHFASCQHCQTLDTNHKEEDSMIEACLMNGGAEPPLLNQLGRSQTWYAQPSRLEC